MPSRIIIVVVVIVALTTPPSAQVPDTKCGEWALPSLPGWFTTWLRVNRYGQTHEIACYANPFYLRGNFDGTGPLDLAVLVVEKATKKRGVLVVHRPTMNAYLVGAGTAVGNGGDDFTWLGYWRVEAPPRSPSIAGGPSIPRFVSEVLYVVKPESASAWIGWNGRQYLWYQGAN